ncbi:MAG: acetyl-coenzyme A synthetase N-terminal domain-containing protein, partial [Terriglobales bacterium]
MDAAAPVLYPPPADFAARAHVSGRAAYDELRRLALSDPEAFWGQHARAGLHWFRPFDQVLEWKAPFARWFLGGTTNASFNCLDRHLAGWRRNKAALLWEGENREQ